MENQELEFASGNEIAAIAVKQIGYDVMGYYPITPSTQIAENLDLMKADGKTDIVMIAAEGDIVLPESAMEPLYPEEESLMPPVPMDCCMLWNNFRYSQEPDILW